MFFSAAPAVSRWKFGGSFGPKKSLFNSYMATAVFLSFGFFTIFIIGITNASSTGHSFWSNSTLAAIFVFVCLLFAWHFAHLYVSAVNALGGRVTLSGRTILPSPSVLMAAGATLRGEVGGGEEDDQVLAQSGPGPEVKVEPTTTTNNNSSWQVLNDQYSLQLAGRVQARPPSIAPFPNNRNAHTRRPGLRKASSAQLHYQHYLEYLMQLKLEGGVEEKFADKKKAEEGGDATSLASSVMTGPPPYDSVVEQNGGEGGDDQQNEQQQPQPANIPDGLETPPPDYFLSSAKEDIFFL